MLRRYLGIKYKEQIYIVVSHCSSCQAQGPSVLSTTDAVKNPSATMLNREMLGGDTKRQKMTQLAQGFRDGCQYSL